MKNYLKVILFISLVSFVVIFSCRKESKHIQKDVLQLGSVSSTSIGVETETEFGEVSIRTDKSGNNVLILKDKDGKGKRLYILQKDGESTAVVNEDLKNAQVIFMQHSVLVNSLDEAKRFYFGVDKDEEKLVYKNLPTLFKTFFTVKSYGYGLAKLNGNIPDDIEVFASASDPYAELLAFRHVNSVESDALIALASCTHGGAGATSCSINGDTGCSVSCKSGYYACCTVGMFSNDCKCLREKPQQ